MCKAILQYIANPRPALAHHTLHQKEEKGGGGRKLAGLGIHRSSNPARATYSKLVSTALKRAEKPRNDIGAAEIFPSHVLPCPGMVSSLLEAEFLLDHKSPLLSFPKRTPLAS